MKYHDPNPQTSFNKCKVSNHRNHVNGNIERKENHYTKKKIKVQILIRKIINANNMNSYKTLYIILMNISTMLKISLQVCSTAEYQPQKL
jgi:hypothetical protein